MLKLVVCVWIQLLAMHVAIAHPGVSIVQDTRGNIFYTDLVHVWIITPAGQKRIAVPNVHTHELRVDRQDNLYGEDLEYEGEAVNRWHHRIWKRSPDGRVTNVFAQRPGFRQDWGFVSDRPGNLYWLQQEATQSLIRRRTPAGLVTTLFPRKRFGLLNWLSLSNNGPTFYATARDELYQIHASGKVDTLIRGRAHQNHSLMGMWSAHNGDIYVADYGGQAVKRFDADGKVSVVARTIAPWSPNGILIDTTGLLWLLEYSTTNQARIRRINANGTSSVF